MKAPCEIIVWYILPGIRSELAKELVKQGLSGKDVSKRLGITQAAVSQYLSDKRGSDVVFGVEVREEIKKLARDIVDGAAPDDLTAQICDICKLFKGGKSICEICDMVKVGKPICKFVT